jgi:hypothetical protein
MSDLRTQLKEKAMELQLEYPANIKTERLQAFIEDTTGEPFVAIVIDDPSQEPPVEAKTVAELYAEEEAKSKDLTVGPARKRIKQTPELMEAKYLRRKTINGQLGGRSITKDVRKNLRYELTVMDRNVWEPGVPYRDPRDKSTLDGIFNA